MTLKKVNDAYNGTGGVIQFFVSSEPGTIATPCKYVILFNAHPCDAHLANNEVQRVRVQYKTNSEYDSQC